MLIDELKKSTSDDHPDYKHLVMAYEAVKKVGNHINETQRKIEGIPKLAQIQSVIADFVIYNLSYERVLILYLLFRMYSSRTEVLSGRARWT
jgi:hypothetical protein